jgi:1-acyl-sn-glycerol-3-phosphate acyltransferase
VSRLHTPKAGFWIRLSVMVLYPFDSLLFRIRWYHLDRMPSTGGVIIAVNHVSHIDTVLMARMVWQSGRIPRFMIKAGVFDLPFIGRLMRGARQIPVRRGTVDAAKSIDAALAALRAGEAVVIYPEGSTTKDPDQWPMQGKSGMARLALAAPDVAVVPVGQWGAQPLRKASWPQKLHRRRVEATVGYPVDLSAFRGQEPTVRVLYAVTDAIMVAVRDEVARLRGESPPTRFFKPKSAKIDKSARP